MRQFLSVNVMSGFLLHRIRRRRRDKQEKRHDWLFLLLRWPLLVCARVQVFLLSTNLFSSIVFHISIHYG